MNNPLTEKIEEIILKNHTYLSYGMLMHASDMEGAREITKQIMALFTSEKKALVEEVRGIVKNYKCGEHKKLLQKIKGLE